MKNYCELIENILVHGTDRGDRTGIGSRFIWGSQLEFHGFDGFPATTIRPVPLRWAFEETMFFLRGETQTRKLEKKGITIWKGNTTREFLDKRGMRTMDDKPWPVGDMGRGYGYQWRNFGADPFGHYGIDQLKECVTTLIKSPESRRNLISAWNPQDLPLTALPPCHVLQHHYANDGELNTLFWMRSNDVIYGLPFNICQYAFINHFLAKLLDLKPGKLVYQCSDAHIYQNQIGIAKKLVDRYHSEGVKPLPKLHIKKDIKSLGDMLKLEWEDLEFEGYDPHPDMRDKPEMAV